jgi:hypothetical protein
VTLSAIEASLPWGLHDAYLETLALDWPKATLTMTVRVMVAKNQDMDQRASIVVTGLLFCSIDAPEIDPHRGYEPTPTEGSASAPGPGDRRRSYVLPTRLACQQTTSGTPESMRARSSGSLVMTLAL